MMRLCPGLRLEPECKRRKVRFWRYGCFCRELEVRVREQGERGAGRDRGVGELGESWCWAYRICR